MNSCIYEGSVGHRRFAPVENAFRYTLFMMYLDLGELDDVFRRRWFWSARRPALAWFRRGDHLGDPEHSLDESVRDVVEVKTGTRPTGPIRLLTHLRYFGHCLNPVSFYYCFNEAGVEVRAIVAEVHNTPWGERHLYVLDPSIRKVGSSDLRYRFDKDFHVSPFMGMAQVYDWRFGTPGEELPVSMISFEDGRVMLEATMSLRRRPITGGQLARVLARYPLMTVKVVAAIYYQALRLRLKRCPYFPHPRHAVPSRAPSS